MNETLRLDANEGPLPPGGVLEAPRAAGLESLRRYPDAAPLAARLALLHGVTAGQVLVTAGGDDAIDRCCRLWLAPGRRLVVTDPVFEMIERFARLTGADIDRVPWTGGAFPLRQVLDRIGETTGLIAVVSPANPTGATLTAAELRALARQARGTPLMLDHVYAEFADQDLTSVALEYSHAVVVRSLSKAWGLAGCRVGYALAAPSIIGRLGTAGAPYPVAGPSLLAAEERLRAGGLAASVGQVRNERARLAALLERCGASSWPSQGNFVLAAFGARAPFVRDALLALGIRVRDFIARPAIPNTLRLSLPGNESEFSRLCGAIETVLAPGALLFDLDGVLADVSGSYRRCIVETAASFGVAVDQSDISRIKARGQANDDWQVTRTLLAERGISVPLADITERFQERYLGSPTQPGLREHERWLLPPERLRRLAARTPLAIVTGRPRAEAEWLLAREGARDCFTALVAREDAALKPDPAPVRAALDRLGTRRAWLFGDTPDDIIAARGAGVLPIGIAAPGEPDGGRALRRAGAACVLSSLGQMESLWS